MGLRRRIALAAIAAGRGVSAEVSTAVQLQIQPQSRPGSLFLARRRRLRRREPHRATARGTACPCEVGDLGRCLSAGATRRVHRLYGLGKSVL